MLVHSGVVTMLDTQVGGNHYSSKSIQPIEYIEANNLNFHEGNVIKYVTRHRLKNGKEDIEKAIWYLQRILEVEYGDAVHTASVHQHKD